MYNFTWGLLYCAYRFPITLWKATGQPMQKITGYHRIINDYVTNLETFARRVHLPVLSTDETWYGVYDKDDNLVGASSWILQFITPDTEPFLARMRRWWYKVKYWVHYRVFFIGRAHPMLNDRLAIVLGSLIPR
jgi:hypothetical protein